MRHRQFMRRTLLLLFLYQWGFSAYSIVWIIVGISVDTYRPPGRRPAAHLRWYPWPVWLRGLSSTFAKLLSLRSRRNIWVLPCVGGPSTS
jgi:hypothetical protein